MLHNVDGRGDAGVEELTIFARVFHGERFDIALSAGAGLYYCTSPLDATALGGEDVHTVDVPPSPVDEWYTPVGDRFILVHDGHSSAPKKNHWGESLPQPRIPLL